MRSHTTLLSALFPQQFEPTLSPSVVNPPPLPHILAFSPQQDVSTLQPLFVYATPPSLCVSLQGRGEAPVIPSTLRACVPLIPDLLLRKGVPLLQSSSILLLFLSFHPCLFNEV